MGGWGRGGAKRCGVLVAMWAPGCYCCWGGRANPVSAQVCCVRSGRRAWPCGRLPPVFGRVGRSNDEPPDVCWATMVLLFIPPQHRNIHMHTHVHTQQPSRHEQQQQQERALRL